MKIWIAPAAALTLGVMLGLVSVRRSVKLPSVDGEARSLESRAHSSAPLKPPVPGEGSFDENLGLLLADIDRADRDRLLVLLFQTIKDRSMPPALAGHVRKQILRRLVDAGAAAEAVDIGDERQREENAGIVAGLLAARDTPDAVDFVFTLPAGPQRQAAIREMLKELGRTAPERGIALLREKVEVREGGSSFFDSWAKQDPMAAAAAALALEEEIPGSFLHSALHRWAMMDPEAALAWANTLPASKVDPARDAIVNGLVNKDADAALEFLLAKPELGDGFTDWIGSQLVRTVEDANALRDRIPPGNFRTRTLRGAARELASWDLDGAVKWANTLLPGENDLVIAAIFDRLSWEDPARAVEVASTVLQGEEATRAMISAASRWMSEDFETAFRALTSRLDDDALRHVLPETLTPTYMIIGRDLPARLALVSELSPETRRTVLTRMGTQWGMASPYQAFEALDAMPPEDRIPFVNGLLPTLSNTTQIPKLMQWLPESKRLEHATSIAQGLAAQDPQAAAQFVLGLPAGHDRKVMAAENLVRKWVYADPNAADGFVSTLQPGREQDKVAAALTRELKYFDAGRATAQLDRISDPALRQQVGREIADMWRGHDPSTGRELLSRAARSEEERRIFLQALEGNR